MVVHDCQITTAALHCDAFNVIDDARLCALLLMANPRGYMHDACKWTTTCDTPTTRQATYPPPTYHDPTLSPPPTAPATHQQNNNMTSDAPPPETCDGSLARGTMHDGHVSMRSPPGKVHHLPCRGCLPSRMHHARMSTNRIRLLHALLVPDALYCTSAGGVMQASRTTNTSSINSP